MDTNEEYKIAVATSEALLRGGVLDRVRRVCEGQKSIRTSRLNKLVKRLEEDLTIYGIYVGNLANKLKNSRNKEVEWQPIETAPKEDGVRVTVGWWEDGEWYEADDEKLDGIWQQHENDRQHFLSVGMLVGGIGPKEEAPYQYWRKFIEIPKERIDEE